MTRLITISILCALLGVSVGCRTAPPSVHGIPNYSEPVPFITTGGQPVEKDSWYYIHTNATGTLIVLKLNLRSEGNDDLPFANTMFVINVPFTLRDQWHDVPAEKVEEAIDILADSAIGSGTFVHCGSDSRTRSWWARVTDTQGGQDRTWFVMGCYLVDRCGWSKDDAWALMRSHGYHPYILGMTWYFWHQLKERK